MSRKLAKFIDHTLLKPEATSDQIKALCKEAIEYGFASVCINPCRVKLASELLKGTDVKVCTVIGFPLGAATPEVKAFETKNAIDNGASEVDMVMNIGAMKEKDYELVEKDIRAVVEAAGGKAIVKVILENCLLEKDEIKKACEICIKAGADFVKTSTGFNKSGATLEDVKLMKETVKDRAGVKAAGGIKDAITAKAMIEAGASRLGTSSSIKIVSEMED
ncbi:MAG: deoxyribose-phosphate aldolase [Thermoanaerobacteraceae bacterium]|jgi:deoxyribose-phosphate aldolase|uniref:Deoxyribose-phosphate aldolase n=1 Tax=Biomaibacter acetigenes TaxID=2316383 RepID=A0A3G2R2V5_9FIRM|nr:deoxyribose-phosphate aldolase [Biomaibacter acetigenes]AYO29803.1 deoxyribose-phosphate aldolase [Biomaibacter acetigenes]MDK2878307.1 deoxyribose-phosphate aldolase [Thermoanaerobacteraceae bacterium]MDN5311334.1 deoxyribose-phosphate aldolase [Thermoanaerobacteraceae bacterium]RKL64445.1 deoxyribose-phosphate aldolase [Thermoanaerobacteraceae bacterium SP2]